MALEPITRQEKIIAGQDLTPITRMEMFLKNFGGGGGGASGADVFIIHATPNETGTNAQLDKTAEQIYEAYQSGKYCLAYVNGVFLQVTYVETDWMICSGFRFSASGHVAVIMLEFTTNDGVTWATRIMPPTLYDVRFFGLQIAGPGNRMYKISVDADGNLTATKVT